MTIVLNSVSDSLLASISFSTLSGDSFFPFDWGLFLCALIRDWTCNLWVSGWRSNQLSYLAQAAVSFLGPWPQNGFCIFIRVLKLKDERRKMTRRGVGTGTWRGRTSRKELTFYTYPTSLKYFLSCPLQKEVAKSWSIHWNQLKYNEALSEQIHYS